MWIDYSKTSFWLTLASITFNPTFWNIAARREYHTRWITRLCGNNQYKGCYLIAVTIFSLGIIRDMIFNYALAQQPTMSLLDSVLVRMVAVLLIGFGMTMVVSSMYMLGITGTYLGDYFGILMDERVTGFPFNVLDNPMYAGSACSFVGTSLWYAKPAGLVISAYVWLAYQVALGYEEPFTAMIYSNRNTDGKQTKKAPAVKTKKKKL